ncbi:hypothetical protein KUTeg_023340 [Tegillarca granosa]|uniref:t-SNARE coiled-coil homology domain-containing protein n=1 Tax=Tegillarca granosa TaxID=220873 RepID=A0ABQ9E6Y3_TEGGR|nr:hypothetical protein KUTeg_023340 [Tegillarca granosa]
MADYRNHRNGRSEEMLDSENQQRVDGLSSKLALDIEEETKESNRYLDDMLEVDVFTTGRFRIIFINLASSFDEHIDLCANNIFSDNSHINSHISTIKRHISLYSLNI